MDVTIILDPRTDVYYGSFYIQGLYDLFSSKNVLFNSRPFAELKKRESNLNFIVKQDKEITRFSISLDDSHEIKRENYEWCDVYGSVNVNYACTPEEFKKKLVPLVPGFGIRLWNRKNTLFYALTNLLRLGKQINYRKFIGRYKRQYLLRLPINEYRKSDPNGNYIYHVSTLWPSDEWINNDENVNMKRALFMNVCKSVPEIQFEGGFYYNGRFKINGQFEQLVFNHFVPIAEYVNKTKKSILVFNTPAWMNCNGWKLGEYLALGKAIISTPLKNDLPESLVHGENIHFVSDDPVETREAILKIWKDKAYREKISNGAYEYYLRNGSPIKSLELMGININSK